MNLEDAPLTIARIAELEEELKQKDALIDGNQKRAWADEQLIDSLRANIEIKAKQLLLAEEQAEHFKAESKRLREQVLDLTKSLAHCAQARREEAEERERLGGYM